ncbi:hypothetical protein [Roseibium aestuarii]|uniref:MotA/TolQ/ExbB proton channel family protein n=1 Tax=Roseibium aestuarii TaxID=2600299 RepID=A0ABW4JRG3_9HYPH|nr:hypothetical protein [Roseibium aestuarii]
MFTTSWLMALGGAATAFAVIIFLYLALRAVHGTKAMPAWVWGDMMTQIVCVMLTAGFAVTAIGTFVAASRLPFEVWGDSAIALALLLASGALAGLVFSSLRGLAHRMSH